MVVMLLMATNETQIEILVLRRAEERASLISVGEGI
jgi:hypothetical protein